MNAAFRYSARDDSGSLRTGVRFGANAGAVARELSGMGWTPLEVMAAPGFVAGNPPAPGAQAGASGAAGEADTAERPGIRLPFMGPGRKRLQESMSMVMRELAALLRAGVPLMRALTLASDASVVAPVRESLHRIARDLDSGRTLVSSAEQERKLNDLFDEYDVAMLRVGEETGRLHESFAELHRSREFARQTAEQVNAALRYPTFVMLTCLIAIVVVNIWVIPAFAKVFARSHTELPLLTRFLLNTSNFFVASWPLLVLGAGALVFGWRKFEASDRGRMWWQRKQLGLPVVGPILRNIAYARLATSLSSGIRAGLTVSDSLVVASRTIGNVWFEERVASMCADLGRGTSISASARQMGALPPALVQLFAIGEETGSLGELMGEIAGHYRAEVDEAVKRLSATLEPILIWFLGIGVLILALGVFMPMWDLGRTIGH